MKMIKHQVYQYIWIISNKILFIKINFFIGGNNIVLIIKIDTIEYALRISIKSYEKKDCEKFMNEIKMMHNLKKLDIGVDIYYSEEEDNIDNYLLLNTNEKFHTFSIIQYCKKGSVFQYINNEDNTFEDKKKKIDKLFDIITQLIEKNIFCYDIKFRNFVVDDTDDVKIIDIGDCYGNGIDSSKNEYEMIYEMIYESVVKIQLFHNCPLSLRKYFASKFNFPKIYKSYEILHNGDDTIYKDNNYIILLSNLFWYYKKLITINYENISDIFNISTVTEKKNKQYIINHQFKEILKLKDPTFYPLIKFYLFLIFSRTISEANDDDVKQTFYKYYMNTDSETESDSSELQLKYNCVKCVINDGRKSVRRKSVRRVRRKSVRRKSVRRKSVRRVRHKSVRRKSVRRKSVRRK